MVCKILFIANLLLLVNTLTPDVSTVSFGIELYYQLPLLLVHCSLALTERELHIQEVPRQRNGFTDRESSLQLIIGGEDVSNNAVLKIICNAVPT